MVKIYLRGCIDYRSICVGFWNRRMSVVFTWNCGKTWSYELTFTRTMWLFCLIGFTRRWDVCHKMFDVLRSQSKLFPPPSSLPFLKADIKLKDQRIKPLKKNLFIYFFPLIFPWPLHLLLVNWTLFLRFIAIALYCPCASQQRIDEIYDFLAENASRPPIGPLPKFHPTRPFDQSVTKEADEGAHGPGNQAQLEMKICSKWRSVKIFSTLAWHSELPPKVEVFSTHHFCSSYRSDSMHQAWSWENMKHKGV